MIGPSVRRVISVYNIGEKDGEVNGVNTVFLVWQSCRNTMQSYTRRASRKTLGGNNSATFFSGEIATTTLEESEALG
jgi:hypothetical protein